MQYCYRSIAVLVPACPDLHQSENSAANFAELAEKSLSMCAVIVRVNVVAHRNVFGEYISRSAEVRCYRAVVIDAAFARQAWIDPFKAPTKAGLQVYGHGHKLIRLTACVYISNIEIFARSGSAGSLTR